MVDPVVLLPVLCLLAPIQMFQIRSPITGLGQGQKAFIRALSVHHLQLSTHVLLLELLQPVTVPITAVTLQFKHIRYPPISKQIPLVTLAMVLQSSSILST